MATHFFNKHGRKAAYRTVVEGTPNRSCGVDYHKLLRVACTFAFDTDVVRNGSDRLRWWQATWGHELTVELGGRYVYDTGCVARATPEISQIIKKHSLR